MENINVTNLSFTNNELHTKKDNVELHESKLQGIVNKWVLSHHKLKKIIINAHIPDQCEKMLGDSIYVGVEIYKQIETKPNFFSHLVILKTILTRFVINTYINQTLIDKHYKTNSDRLTVFTTRLTGLDPTVKNLVFHIPIPTIDMYLNFPISNDDFHSTHENT